MKSKIKLAGDLRRMTMSAIRVTMVGIKLNHTSHELCAWHVGSVEQTSGGWVPRQKRRGGGHVLGRVGHPRPHFVDGEEDGTNARRQRELHGQDQVDLAQERCGWCALNKGAV